MRDGEHRVLLNGIRHWYRVVGTAHGGIPIVALHGGPGGNHFVFERTVLPQLAESLTTVCYEQRGCGRTDAPGRDDAYSIELLISDLDELRRDLGLERLFLLGYSFGAELALEYALAYPTRVVGLVLQAPSGVADPEDAALVQLAGFEAVAVGVDRERIRGILGAGGTATEKLARVWSAVESTTADAFLFTDRSVARQNRRWWDESGLRNTGAMETALAATGEGRVPLRDRVHTLEIPALVIVGREDRNVGVDACAGFARLMRAARLQVFERSAHFPDLEEPGRYVDSVVAFCRDLSGAVSN
jgi:proline iminopeptidase